VATKITTRGATQPAGAAAKPPGPPPAATAAASRKRWRAARTLRE